MPQQSVLNVTSSSAMTGPRLEHALPPNAPSIKARVQCVQKPKNAAHVDPQYEDISTLQTSRATDGASDATGASGSCVDVAVEAVPRQRHPSLSRLQPVNAVPDTAVTPTTKHKAAPPARADKEAIKTLMRTQPAHTDTPNPQHAPATSHGSAGSHAHDSARTTSTGDVAPLGRGRRARKLTTKLVAAGADGIAALSRSLPLRAASPRARAPKRSREDPREDKASSEAAAGSSMTVAFVRAPTPTPAATFADAASTATARGKRSRKGTPARASE